MVDYGKFKNYFFKGNYEELNEEFLKYVFGDGEDFDSYENFGLEMYGMMVEGFDGIFDKIGDDGFDESLDLYIGFCNILYDIFKIKDFVKVIEGLEKVKKFYLDNKGKIDDGKLNEKVDDKLVKICNKFYKVEEKLNYE